jgi:hypothetical protein
MRVDIEVEVDDEAVTQVLGGEIIQWRGCDEPCDRGSAVSLVVHSLYELRERRPVSLSEESLVESSFAWAKQASRRSDLRPSRVNE